MSVILSIVIRIMDRIDPSPILSIIHTATIGIMLNNNVDNNRHGLKTLHVNRPSVTNEEDFILTIKSLQGLLKKKLCQIFVGKILGDIWL